MSEKFTMFWSGVFSQWQISKFTVSFNDTNKNPRFNVLKIHQYSFDDFLDTIEYDLPIHFKISPNRTVEFNCAEQFMMFMKAIIFEDYNIAKKILLADHPRDQKALDREVKNYNDEVWQSVAKDVVYVGSYCKYTQDEYLMNKLLLALNRDTWQGTNWLGEVLTDLRNDYIRDNGLSVTPVSKTTTNICE